MRKGPGSAYDKWNMFVVICGTDYLQIPYCLTKSWWRLQNCRSDDFNFNH